MQQLKLGELIWQMHLGCYAPHFCTYNIDLCFQEQTREHALQAATLPPLSRIASSWVCCSHFCHWFRSTPIILDHVGAARNGFRNLLSKAFPLTLSVIQLWWRLMQELEKWLVPKETWHDSEGDVNSMILLCHFTGSTWFALYASIGYCPCLQILYLQRAVPFNF